MARHMKKEKRKSAGKIKSAVSALICPPDAAGRSPALRAVGYVCRILVIFCAVNGLASLINSAFKIAGDGATTLPSLLAVTVLSLMCYRWYIAPVGVAAVGGLVALHLSAQSDVLWYISNVVTAGFNAIMRRLYSAGYYGYNQYVVELSVDEETLALLEKDFAVLLSWVLAIAFVPFLARRIRIVVPMIVSVAVPVAIFTFNIPASNWSITAMIAGFAAVLIMWAYQRLYDKKESALIREKHELFADTRPEIPARLRDREAWAAARAEELAKIRQRKKERRATGLVTVEDELNEYVGVSKKKAAKTAADDEEKKYKAAERKKERAQLAALRRYDRITVDTRLAMGGLAGFAMMLLTLLILFIPTMTVTGAFNTIDSIDRRMEYYREYVTAFLRGDDPAIDMYEYGEDPNNRQPHSATAQTQTFKNINLMRIYTQFDSNLYMQGWLGVDYVDGAWQSVDEETLAQWRDLYGVSAMPNETVFELFAELYLPAKLEREKLATKYYSYEDYGFVAYMANVERLRSLGMELYLPRVMSRTYGVLSHRTLIPHEIGYANFFDGIMVSSLFDEARAAYSAEVYAPLQLDPDWYKNTAALIAAYNASEKEIDRYESLKNKRAFKSSYKGTQTPTGFSLAQDYVEVMPAAARARTKQYLDYVDTYADFVYGTYTGKADSAIIRDFAQQIYTSSYADESYAASQVDVVTGEVVRGELLPGAQPLDFSMAAQRDSSDARTYEQRHLLTMAVIDRLVSDCEYTLTITKQADPALCGVENFLSVTEEGYCVQFASAAALLLRELDIPVRYVEGYLCSDYTRRVYADDDLGRFIGVVRDSDKHAWIEVWYDGIGWIVYETTPAYYVNLYGNTSLAADSISPIIPGTTKPEDSDPEIVIPVPPIDIPGTEGEGEGEGTIDMQALIRGVLLLAAILLIVLAVILVIVHFCRKAKRAQLAREQLAKDAIARADAIFDTEEHRADAASRLIRQTLDLLTIYGTAPQKGELKDEYAKRISFAYEDTFGYPMEYADNATDAKEVVSEMRIGDVMDAIAAEEFGYGMTDKGMADLGAFYLALIAQKKKRLGAWKRFKLHYFKRVI